jgi:isoleucyl-tRNA synthetase
VDERLLTEWDKLREVRESALKSLEAARQSGMIGNSLEAKVSIRAAGETAELLQRHQSDLRYIFIVSQVELNRDDSNQTLNIDVMKADGIKCGRCWNYSAEVGQDKEFSTLCERCAPAVRTMANHEL